VHINRNIAISSGLAAVLAAGSIYAGTAFAQAQSSGASPSPSATSSAAGSGFNGRSSFLQHLAQRLGISQDQVQTAIKTASKDAVADAVSAGRLTQAQADKIDQRIDNGQGGFPGAFGRGPGGPRPNGARPGARPNGAAVLNAAAGALNMQPADLRTQLRSGKSLKDVAAAQNVDFSKVQAAITNAVKPQLDQAVQAGKLTQQQETNILNRITSGNFPPTPGRGFARGPRPSASAGSSPSASPSA